MSEIILPNQSPQIDHPPDGQLIVARLTHDTELTFENGNVTPLDPPLTDVFNALLITRDQFLSAEKIREKTDSQVTTPQLKKRIGALAATLLESARTDIIEVDGHDLSTLTYRITPLLTITDRRPELTGTLSEHPIARLRNFVASQEAYTPKTRTTVMSFLLQAYSNHPRIRSRLTTLYRQNIIATQQGYLPDNGIPTDQDCEAYFMRIEKGIVSVFEERDLSRAEELSIDMVDAYHTLYYRHTFLIGALTQQFRRDQVPYEELFQEGNFAFLELITSYISDDHTAADSEGSTFAEDVTHAISLRMKSLSGYSKEKVMTPTVMRRRAAIDEAREAYMEQHGHQPTFRQLASILGLTNKEVIEAVANPHRERKAPEPALDKAEEQRRHFVRELENEAFQEGVQDLLQGDILTPREKIVVSLYFGIFVEGLVGANFVARSSFLYPYSAEDMPEKPLTALQISELLGVSVNMVQALLSIGLENSRAYLQAKGFGAADDLL